MKTIPPEEPPTLWIQLRSNLVKLLSKKADKDMTKTNTKSNIGNHKVTLIGCSSSSNSLSDLWSMYRGEATARTTKLMAATLSKEETLLPLLLTSDSIQKID